jgi:hypothetical protein
MITLEQREWEHIYKKLKVDWTHKPSVFLIRDVMKRELGFTTRSHQDWNQGRYRDIMYLDFYDDSAETMFRLKYL